MNTRLETPREQLPTGILLILAAFVMITGIDTCAKWLVTSGFPVGEVVFVRYAVHVAIVCGMFAPKMGVSLLKSARPRVEFARAVCLLSSTIFNFLAVKYLPLTVTATIFFTMPLWLCALSAPMLGERIGPRRLAAVVIGFLGVVIAMQPWTAEVHWAFIYAIASAVSIALYVIFTRQLAHIDTTATQQFYAGVFCMAAVTPFVFGEWVWPASQLGWVVFVLIGVFGWAGHELVIIAHRFAPATALAPFTYSQLLFMSLSSWLFFHEPPTVSITLGGAVICACGLYVWLRERQQAAGGH